MSRYASTNHRHFDNARRRVVKPRAEEGLGGTCPSARVHQTKEAVEEELHHLTEPVAKSRYQLQ